MSKTMILRDPTVLDYAIRYLSSLDLGLKKPWSITVRPYVKPRNLEQNAAYHSAIGDIARHVGHSHEDIHEIVKLKFLAPKAIELPDGDYTIGRSTTKLTVEEMSTLIDEVHAWGGGLGVEFTG